MNKYNVPPKIAVGFNNRADTYTGKLGFVVRVSENDKINSEKSWNGWRDKKIDPMMLDNEPTEGFVLNKGVGGVRGSWSSWNPRNEYIRVYDPRGFEFEISVPNLLLILQECSSIKGKGLEGKFVYAWSGSSKVMLLPVDSQEYKKSCDLATLKAKRVNKKEMGPGCTYLTQESDQVIYLGRFEWVEFGYNYRSYNREFTRKKRHIFVFANKMDKDKNYKGRYWVQTGFTKLSEKLTDTPISTFAEIFDDFSNSIFAALPSEFAVGPDKKIKLDLWGYYNNRDTWLRQDDGSYLHCRCQKAYDSRAWYIKQKETEPKNRYDIHSGCRVSFSDGEFKLDYMGDQVIKSNLTEDEVRAIVFVGLSVKLTNGEKVKLDF